MQAADVCLGRQFDGAKLRRCASPPQASSRDSGQDPCPVDLARFSPAARGVSRLSRYAGGRQKTAICACGPVRRDSCVPIAEVSAAPARSRGSWV